MQGRLLYGGDYNPEQWLASPDILAKDIEYLKRAGCNAVTMGMFSWAALEPKEGSYSFDWLEQIINNLYDQGISTILGTPSGARPHWLADTYPEVLRVDESRNRNLFGLRHNHCYTSPQYREKVRQINEALSRRFGSHPGVILWHLSNEYGGECHCPLCQDAFRAWLKEEYSDIEQLNHAWWAAFWSHTYRSFDEVESPSPRGETATHGLTLAWKRFVTAQTVDFMRHEAAAVKQHSTLPITTNLMYRFDPLDYHKFADDLDIVSWDSYPSWGHHALPKTAYDTGYWHDVIRSIKKKPFLLMESCPSATNWQPVSKLKRPGILELSSLQAIAHGSDSVLYFQIRQSRGSCEKFHGALIDQYGGDDTRVFKEATETGDALLALREVQGSESRAKVAMIHDWENKWALEDSKGPRNLDMHFEEHTLKQYTALRRLGLDVDIIDMSQPLDGYKVVTAPLLYMFKKGYAERIRAFIEEGGTFILGHFSGIVDRDDLCYLGGTPHGLMEVFGLRREETDALYDGEQNSILPLPHNSLGLRSAYSCRNLCDLLKLSGAEALMSYGEDFYMGMPAVTLNAWGKGTAVYVGADAEEALYRDLFTILAERAGLVLPQVGLLPEGLNINRRWSAEKEFLFIQNYTATSQSIAPFLEGYELLYGTPLDGGHIKPSATLVYAKTI